MATVSSSITINQPVDKVFAYIIAVENHKAWQAGVLEAKEGGRSNPLGILVHTSPLLLRWKLPGSAR